MKKIILYFLLLLLLAGFAVLFFGFYNAKNIRAFSKNARTLNAKYDDALELKEAEKSYQKGDTESAVDLKKESDDFLLKLEKMLKSAEAAQREVEDLSIPVSENGMKKEMLGYYAAAEGEIRDVINITKFSNQVFQVAIIFDRIKQDVTLDEIKNLIVEAKRENTKVETKELPESLKKSGEELKEATDKFLSEMEVLASGASENTEQLNDSYAEFSGKEVAFFSGSHEYINSLKDLSPLRKKIDFELENVEKIYFTIR